MHLMGFVVFSTNSSLDPLKSCGIEGLCSFEVAPGVSIPLSETSVSEESAHSARSVTSNRADVK